MADILIRGMEIPNNVFDCPLNSFGICNLAQDETHCDCIGDSRPEWCPLVPLPEGHGRLGDLDALMPDFVKARWEFFSDGDTFLRLLKNAPTIIEADLEWKMKNCCCFSNTDQAEGGKANEKPV